MSGGKMPSNLSEALPSMYNGYFSWNGPGL